MNVGDTPVQMRKRRKSELTRHNAPPRTLRTPSLLSLYIFYDLVPCDRDRYSEPNETRKKKPIKAVRDTAGGGGCCDVLFAFKLNSAIPFAPAAEFLMS